MCDPTDAGTVTAFIVNAALATLGDGVTAGDPSRDGGAAAALSALRPKQSRCLGGRQRLRH
jgi:hypothetical protein